MNKRKIIFVLVIIFIFLGIFYWVSTLESKPNVNPANTSQKTFKIWTFGDSKEKLNDFITNFKNDSKTFKDANIEVENFKDFKEYEYMLQSSILAGKSPDIFVLNNNEKSILEDQAVGIPSTVINPSDFRKKYNQVFGDDLILKVGKGEKSTEILKGIPIGYEVLGVFFNRKFIKSTDLQNWAGFNTAISVLKNENPDLIPIGIGNGSTVYGVSEIITQFLMGEGITNLEKNVLGDNFKAGILSYLLYGDEKGYNSYNSKFSSLKSSGENNLDLFSKGEVLSVIGYPRMIEQIDEKGFNSSFLLATKFPSFLNKNEKTLVNYNYFVINKDTSNIDLAYGLLSYMASEQGARNYLKKFTYYLPALISLESEKIKEDISSSYNINLGDFYDNKRELSSFDRGIKTFYDQEIVDILDNEVNYSSLFDKLRNKIICINKKLNTFQDLSVDCDK